MSIFRKQACGFTLIEVVIFLVVISVAVVGIVQVIGNSTSKSADPQLRKQALVLAESMLEEVQLARFTYCDPVLDPAAETATNALPFDANGNPGGCTTPQNVGAAPSNNVRPYYNVTDYVRAFNAPLAYTQDAAGNNFPAGYNVTVALAPEAALGPAGTPVAAAGGPVNATPASMEALRITVVVTYAGGQAITLVGYRARYAPNLI
ncbi:prepilin-type N-terminal cleavage/methylation domain-containing protein [Janthinobacterium sp.]|uniref:prepilin-type N-terminal cleavage/methylation domain-containing protein n=1 Tax=Janthinobacterium sp. TaxID=1871054 RepID=UPI0028A02803|nr:prepilin-type N-terminal cleavage/methylation domain-containing protein [Janthinobacterium sp.]